jgi:hypothetical protein
MKLQEMETETETNQIDRKATGMNVLFSGGCACGAIRYESTAEPVRMFHCHCRDCQRASGGPYSSYVVVPADAFKLLQGSLPFHPLPSERGGMTRRGFCPECGSPIAVKPDAAPQLVGIRTASLDDPSWFKPQMDTWVSDAHAWDEMNSGLPKFEKYPV